MNKELSYVQNPTRYRLKIIIAYGLIMIIVALGIFQIASQIKTRTLPVGQIELHVAHTRYLVGEPITFTITNNYNSTIYVANNCPTEPLNVYRQVSGKWQRVHDQADKKDCSTEDRQIKIPASGSIASSFAPWKHLFEQPGKYRVVAYVEYYNALPYQELEIIAPPALTPMPVNKPTNNGDGEESRINQRSTTIARGGVGTNTQTHTPTNNPNAVTYTVTVTSSGVYSPSVLELAVGDSIKFIYINPIDEVITAFTPGNIGAVKLDSEFRTGTRTFSSTGVWTFKAVGLNGNKGTVTVE